jgi:hypothetical protein
VTPAEAKAYLARWPQVAAVERAELAQRSLEERFARSAAPTAGAEPRRGPSVLADASRIERWARMRAVRGG